MYSTSSSTYCSYVVLYFVRNYFFHGEELHCIKTQLRDPRDKLCSDRLSLEISTQIIIFLSHSMSSTVTARKNSSFLSCTKVIFR
jgi:hypothetical protein